jgi:hypothetical protein
MSLFAAVVVTERVESRDRGAVAVVGYFVTGIECGTG